MSDLGTKDAVVAVQRDHRQAGLSERDVEMLNFAELVSVAAYRIAQEHIERLRSVGFSDVQISDIALCVAFRSFVSRNSDEMGAGPETAFIDTDVEFSNAMTVGKPI